MCWSFYDFVLLPLCLCSIVIFNLLQVYISCGCSNVREWLEICGYHISNKRFIVPNTEFNILPSLQMACQHVCLNWLFQRPPIIKMSEHQQQSFPEMDAIKDCWSFITLNHWPHVEGFNLIIRIKSLVC